MHKLQQTIDYIQVHLAEDVSLETIATEFDMSQYHFARMSVKCHFTKLSSPNQPEMVRRTSAELERAMSNSPGLLSATFHRSLDGTRMFNYGQWESKEAFEVILKQPGFNPDKPYWEGLARNEFHLYNVVHTQTAA